MATAAAMPATPPSTANHRLPWVAWAAASRKTAVSKPSLSTARKAMAASARAPPPLIACAASRSNSPFIRKALRFIQMIIVVTKTTAMAPMTVSSISCCRWGRDGGHDLQPHADRDADGDGQPDADEHRPHGLVVPVQEGADDADDERGFETLAQADEERANENALHVSPVN